MTKICEMPLCGAKLLTMDTGRRRCIECKKTWTVRPSRGRRARRITESPARRYFESRARSHRQRAARHHCCRRQAFVPSDCGKNGMPSTRSRCGATLDGLLILVADGNCKISQWRVAYMVLHVRTSGGRGEDATHSTAIHTPGREVYKEWSNALETIPPDALNRVKALVSDGHRGLMSFALRQDWFVQRSHSSHYGNSGKEEQVGNEPQKKRGGKNYMH